MEIKAIKTKYNGIEFRSRLEARWATFFDKLKIKYIYEPEGFNFGDGVYYLPDFYFPELDMYGEVKGVMGEIDADKIAHLVIGTKKDVIVFDSEMEFSLLRYEQMKEFTHKTIKLLINDAGGLNMLKLSSSISYCEMCKRYYFSIGSDLTSNDYSNKWLKKLSQCKYCGSDLFKYIVDGFGECFLPWEVSEVRMFKDSAKSAKFEFGDSK